MVFRFLLLLVLFAGLVVWIDFLNQGTVKIILPPGTEVEPTKMAVMLGSAVFGAMVVFIGFFVQATGDFFRNWKRSRARQKDEKVQGLYSKGLNSLLARRNDQAIGYFEKVLAIRPNHSEALLRLGSIYHKEGDYAEAVKLHQRARNADERSVEALFALSADYEDSGRKEEAIRALEEALKNDENNLRALTRIRDLHLRSGEFEQAEEVQERILKLSLPAREREAEQQRLLGLKYETGRVALEDGNLDKAKKAFKGILKADKNYVPAHLGLGEVCLEEGENEEAAALWEEAYKATGSIIFLHRLEDLYLKLGMPGKIINLYKGALHASPRDVNLNFFLGRLFYRLEMVDEAFQTLSAIDSSTRQMTDLHKLLGNLYVRRGQPMKAVEEFRKALAYSDQLIVPYKCTNCDHFSTEWAGRCPRCGKWNTFAIDLDKYC